MIVGLLAMSHVIRTAQMATANVSSSNTITGNPVKPSKKKDAVSPFSLGANRSGVDGYPDFVGSYFNERSDQKFSKANSESLAFAPPIVTKSFGASSVPPGSVTTLTINFTNPNIPSPFDNGFLFNLGITDNLPTGMVVYSQPNTVNTCGGAVIAVPNTSIVQFIGGFLPPASSCFIRILVQATIPGPKVNVTDLVSSSAGIGNSATAALTVSCPGNFTVDNLGDANDPSPGDGVCGTNYLGVTGGCTLRAAIQEANAISTFCPPIYSINFQVAGTIRLLLGPLTINSGRIVTINGLGANVLTVSGNNNNGVFVNNGVTTIARLTITGGNVTNTVGGAGGGVSSSAITTLNDCVVTGNAARTGGGISATGGNLTLNRTTVSANTANEAGGIYAQGTTTDIRNSTISGNSGANGEGLRNIASGSNSTMTLTNSTVSGNMTTSQNSAIGSDAATGFTSTINLTNCTVTNNSTTSAGDGAIWLRPSGGTHSVTLKNTIVSGNTSGGLPFDIEGIVNASSSFNLIGTGGGLTNGVSSNIVGVNNPQIGPLANNTGATQTHALLTGSPAIDKGSAVSGITTDQRGSTRPIDNPSVPNATGGDGSDIGAFELNSTIAAPTFISANNALFQVSTPGSFTITTLGNPTPTISLSGGTLPTGVTFVNNGNGTATLSGTPAANAGGTYQLIFTASNGINPNATQNFTLTVGVPISFTNSPFATFLVGAANNYTITTIGIPVPTISRTAGNLPQGLLYTDNGNGTATISGNPVSGSGGVYPLTIAASNGISADAVQNFILTINEAPVITSPNTAGFLVNTSGNFRVTTNGYPFPVNLSVNGMLPNNITFNPSNGLFTGTPDASSLGTYPLVIQAANGISPDYFQNFTLKVCQSAVVQVTNNANSGAGSLRQAIIDACPGSVITFAPNVTGQINVNSIINIDKDLFIQGPGANVLTLRGVSERIFLVGDSFVGISGLTLTNGNTSFFGGAVINTGKLTLTNVVVSNSNASSDGGGIYNSGNLTLIGSTISGNSGRYGGGIYSFGTLNIVNSTISGNNSTASGGGIYVDGILNITNATITGNRADRDNNGNGLGGGIFNNNLNGNNPVTLRNNIIIGNFLRPTFASPAPNDLDGTFFPNSFYNLIGDSATSGGISNNNNGNIVGNNGSGTINVNLVINSSLTPNRGTTPIHALVTNSLAIDQGSAASGITTDQRGLSRPCDNPLIPNAAGGDGSDIGAFEVQSPTAASVSVGGRILTSDGRGLRNAIVSLTDDNGITRTIRTGTLGYYSFEDVEIGRTYIISIVSKVYVFAPQVITVVEEMNGLNFTAQN
jgi:CSLREA domain-containing protein